MAVSGGFDKAVRVWDLRTGQLRGSPLTGHDSWVKGVACITLDDRPVAVTAGFDATLRVWDLASGRVHGEPLTGHASEVTTVELHHAGGPAGSGQRGDGRHRAGMGPCYRAGHPAAH